MTTRVLVIGAGQAGCQVVTSLRETDFTGCVTLIGAERHLPYQRPPLSKGHLTGTAAREALWLRPQRWFDDHDVELRLGVEVTEIDRGTGSVRLSTGESLPYDVLVLALGARNRTLAVDGINLDGVVSLRDLDDADRLRPLLEAAHDVVVVGGGFIGMEVAATAAKLGKAAVVVEAAPQLMGRVLSTDTAGVLLEAHRTRGLTIRLGSGVTELIGSGGAVRAVVVAGGEQLPADLVLVGVGALPNDELARSAGLAVENGILVDSALQTSDPQIFAIGDCANAPNSYADNDRVRLESVQNAVSQARRVAGAITDQPEHADDVPWFWSDQADLKLQIAGLTSGHNQTVVTGDVDGEKFSTYCFRDSVLVGVESVNRPADHMAARRLLALPRSVTIDEVRADDFNAKTLLETAKKPVHTV